MGRLWNINRTHMHRKIKYILLAAAVLVAACSKEQPVNPKPEREKTDSEKVEESLLETASFVSSLGLSTLDEFIEFYKSHKDVKISDHDTTVSVIYEGFQIISAKMRNYPSKEMSSYELTVGERVTFNISPDIKLASLYDYMFPDYYLTEDEARAMIEEFNTTYESRYSLDGADMGEVRMKAFNDDGRITPSFVMNYNDGASCYFQPDLFMPTGFSLSQLSGMLQ